MILRIAYQFGYSDEKYNFWRGHQQRIKFNNNTFTMNFYMSFSVIYFFTGKKSLVTIARLALTPVILVRKTW